MISVPKTLLGIAMAVSISACTTSVPEVTRYEDETLTITMRALEGQYNMWQITFNNEPVITARGGFWTLDKPLIGTWRGKQVMARKYYRGNGWVSNLVADIFVDGELIETLVLS